MIRGLFGQLAYLVSGKKSAARKLVGSIVDNESQHIIDARYTPELTARLTHLSGDTLGYFMNAYPATVALVQETTDLDFMMWIRLNYRDWLAKGKPMPHRIADTAFTQQ